MNETENKNDEIFFHQGGEAIGGEDCLKSIKQKIAELYRV
jgi:hypothetical protein